jgi:isopentenyl diphosphate isomerase/L-lactate dehydrogenase-like FMN-dependent dehydrogenase
MLRKAMVTWRKNSYAECVKSMQAMEQTYANTLEANDQRMSNIIRAKHARAERIIKSKKLRAANNTFIEMTKTLKQLRVRQEALNKNVQFLKQRESIRKWFKRSQVTIYMRKRTAKLAKEWNCKLMRTCFEAIRECLVNDRKFARKLVQIG